MATCRRAAYGAPSCCSGHRRTRRRANPRATLIVDTREKDPFSFSRFARWFERIEYRALPLGDYSVAGLEDSCIVERKSLPDLVHSLTADRTVFIARLRRMSQAANRLLVIQKLFC